MDLFLADAFLDLNPSMKAGVGLFSDISGKIYVKKSLYIHALKPVWIPRKLMQLNFQLPVD